MHTLTTVALLLAFAWPQLVSGVINSEKFLEIGENYIKAIDGFLRKVNETHPKTEENVSLSRTVGEGILDDIYDSRVKGNLREKWEQLASGSQEAVERLSSENLQVYETVNATTERLETTEKEFTEIQGAVSALQDVVTRKTQTWATLAAAKADELKLREAVSSLRVLIADLKNEVNALENAEAAASSHRSRMTFKSEKIVHKSGRNIHVTLYSD